MYNITKFHEKQAKTCACRVQNQLPNTLFMVINRIGKGLKISRGPALFGRNRYLVIRLPGIRGQHNERIINLHQKCMCIWQYANIGGIKGCIFIVISSLTRKSDHGKKTKQRVSSYIQFKVVFLLFIAPAGSLTLRGNHYYFPVLG